MYMGVWEFLPLLHLARGASREWAAHAVGPLTSAFSLASRQTKSRSQRLSPAPRESTMCTLSQWQAYAASSRLPDARWLVYCACEGGIMQQTGHRSVAMVRPYIREGSLFRENSAGKFRASAEGAG
jgi:hypothetical protein